MKLKKSIGLVITGVLLSPLFLTTGITHTQVQAETTQQVQTSSNRQTLKPQGYVTDNAGVVSQETKQQVNNTAQSNKQERTKPQVAIMTFKTTKQYSLKDLVGKLLPYRAYHIGNRNYNNGVWIFYAQNNGHPSVRVVPGKGLHNVLTKEWIANLLQAHKSDLLSQDKTKVDQGLRSVFTDVNQRVVSNQDKLAYVNRGNSTSKGNNQTIIQNGGISTSNVKAHSHSNLGKIVIAILFIFFILFLPIIFLIAILSDRKDKNNTTDNRYYSSGEYTRRTSTTTSDTSSNQAPHYTYNTFNQSNPGYAQNYDSGSHWGSYLMAGAGGYLLGRMMFDGGHHYGGYDDYAFMESNLNTNNVVNNNTYVNTNNDDNWNDPNDNNYPGGDMNNSDGDGINDDTPANNSGDLGDGDLSDLGDGDLNSPGGFDSGDTGGFDSGDTGGFDSGDTGGFDGGGFDGGGFDGGGFDGGGFDGGGFDGGGGDF